MNYSLLSYNKSTEAIGTKICFFLSRYNYIISDTPLAGWLSVQLNINSNATCLLIGPQSWRSHFERKFFLEYKYV